MPTLHLVCGLPGAGETTLARTLAGVRLCPDEWMAACGAERIDRRAAAEALCARVPLHYLAVPHDERWRRTHRRNRHPEPGHVAISRASLETFEPLFEVPTDDELR